MVNGQRLMQTSSDIFLGWVHNPGGLDGVARDFYGRQLKDWKGSAEIEQMLPEGMSVTRPLGDNGFDVPFDVEAVLKNADWLSYCVNSAGLEERNGTYYHRLHPIWISRPN